MVEGVTRYLQHGGRLVDTAPTYHDGEHAVGKAIREAGVPREDVWITTKIEAADAPLLFARGWASGTVDQTLLDMGLSYLDVMYIHVGPELSRGQVSLAQNVEVWKGLIDAKLAGKVLNIGVCMHTRSEIEMLINATGQTPAVVMGFYSPFMPPEQVEFVRWVQSQGIAFSAYGLFNWYHGYWAETDQTPAQAKAFETVATQHPNATWGQMVIRSLLQQNVAITTDLYDQQYLNEDLNCPTSWTLTATDIQTIERAPHWTCSTQDEAQRLSGCYA